MNGRSDRTASGLQSYAMLLRGVNVGGRNRLPMSLLRAILERSGCAGVRTYIQSGNAVFRASESVAHAALRATRAHIARHLGRKIPVCLRTGDELARIVQDNPFPDAEKAPRTLHVGFCEEVPAPERIAALDPNRSPPDRHCCRGREIYLHLPNGFARSKFTNAHFDAVLATLSTFRNWRTVLKLLELAAEQDQRGRP